jgi:probable biosynthetic protein (TIGR04098 family)
VFDRWRLEGSVLHADVEIGIPLTGRTGLGETPLLKLLADIRWRQLTTLLGAESKDLVDDDGSRLYASIYFVEIACPEGGCLADIGENDKLTLVNPLVTDGTSLLDGHHFFFPYDWEAERKVALADGQAALEMGVPFAHISNAFVKMVKGASWLKKGEPAAGQITRIPTGSGPQQTYQRMTLVAGGNRTWRMPDDTFDPLTAGKVEHEYVPDADRDLNGLGLMYFANYPAVLDVTERRVLRENEVLPLSDDLLDLRSVARRQHAYVSNIVPPDVIDVAVEAWIQNPFRSGATDAEAAPVRLFLNYVMHRRSDGRKMLVSTAEKLIHGRTVGDAGLADSLERLAGEPVAISPGPA